MIDGLFLTIDKRIIANSHRPFGSWILFWDFATWERVLDPAIFDLGRGLICCWRTGTCGGVSLFVLVRPLPWLVGVLPRRLSPPGRRNWDPFGDKQQAPAETALDDVRKVLGSRRSLFLR